MGNDLISELPDCLITKILLLLPTKDSVKTSALSTRWRNLWLDVQGLEIDSDDFPYPCKYIITDFTERFLKFNKDSPLQKFKMKNTHDIYNTVSSNRLKKWISKAVDSGIQELDFETENILTYDKDYMPMKIYKSKTLVSLKLQCVRLGNPKFVVSLPCLKIMHLQSIAYHHHGPLIVEKLISGCPVLEDLTIVSIHGEDLRALPLLRVRSLTLKMFRLRFYCKMFSGHTSVEIDAPKLQYMSFLDRHSDRIMVQNMSSLFKIHLNTKFGDSTLEPDDLKKRDIIGDFLTDISSVRHMIISKCTLEVIYCYSKLRPIPKFQHLYHLHAAISSSSLQLLPTFLESCPNLKKLILELAVSTGPGQIDVTSVPRCLTTTLECIEIHNLIRKEANGIKLVEYFRENAPVLKDLKLRFTESV